MSVNIPLLEATVVSCKIMLSPYLIFLPLLQLLLSHVMALTYPVQPIVVVYINVFV